ncbi:CGNR zinc finger domain-containing protein [Maritalea porphyrae]|uniref:Zinc finger CGNR domain-containing protein n=1 Tax=Maritalea porphyrae TaxID=880732 RepID=A0ABQ5UTL0_9HYPH|nr:CGNR zinc finger domain-containing protein [Maritalea porphyrae]GLQ18055.1 hypothetical protein GCM10007879_23040 [Maritalea porphyrae]
MVDSPFFVKFVNSLHISSIDTRTDHLHDPSYLSRRANEWGFTDTELTEDMNSLLALRTAIRNVLFQVSRQGTVEPEDLAFINSVIKPEVRLLELIASEKTIVETKTTKENTYSPHEFLAHDFARSVAHYGIKRFKLCANDTCLWAFHDTSKNGSKKWCSSAACGNTDKVRRFRERKKNAT